MCKFSNYESRFFHSVLEKQDRLLEEQFTVIQSRLTEIQVTVRKLTDKVINFSDYPMTIKP